MDCSTPGFPVHHQLPKLAQTHVHRVGDAIQPSHPLSSSLLLPSIFPSIRVFSKESDLRFRWPKYWSFSFRINLSNEYSGLISFRIDWFDLLAVQGTLKSLLLMTELFFFIIIAIIVPDFQGLILKVRWPFPAQTYPIRAAAMATHLGRFGFNSSSSLASYLPSWNLSFQFHS